MSENGGLRGGWGWEQRQMAPFEQMFQRSNQHSKPPVTHGSNWVRGSSTKACVVLRTFCLTSASLWHASGQATSGRRLCSAGFERGLPFTLFTFFENVIPPPTSQFFIFVVAKIFSKGGALNAIANIKRRHARTPEKSTWHRRFSNDEKLTMSGNFYDLYVRAFNPKGAVCCNV